jgi:hypothetical protein
VKSVVLKAALLVALDLSLVGMWASVKVDLSDEMKLELKLVQTIETVCQLVEMMGM